MIVLTTLLYILFVLSAIVLIVVILLQEGKGGGFGQALGEHGQQTFGVGAKGINTFTGYTAAVFLFCALMLHIFNRRIHSESALDSGSQLDAPAEPGAGPGAATAPVAPPAAPAPSAPNGKK